MSSDPPNEVGVWLKIDHRLHVNQFSFYQKYCCYFEYFQQGKGLLRCHLLFSD